MPPPDGDIFPRALRSSPLAASLPELIAEIAGQKKVFDKYFQKPFQSQAELLCVWGVEMMYHTSGYTDLVETAPHADRDEFNVIENISRCSVRMTVRQKLPLSLRMGKSLPER